MNWGGGRRRRRMMMEWTPSAEESLVTYGSYELALYPHNQWLLTVDFRRRKGGGGKSRRYVLPYKRLSSDIKQPEI
jgi:hypothetical protein